MGQDGHVAGSTHVGRLRGFLLGVICGCVLTGIVVVAGVAYMGSGDLIERCALSAPDDLEVWQVSVTYETDYRHGVLTCRWSGLSDSLPYRQEEIPLYKR